VQYRCRARLVPVANTGDPRASRSALASGGGARVGSTCLPTGASRGGTASQARFLKRQLSLPVLMICSDGSGGRAARLSSWCRRTRRNATVLERLPPPGIRVSDATHPFFGQLLEVSASAPSRRIGWVQVVLPDGRHRWIPQKATDLEDAAGEARPNRDLPRVSVRTLLPLAEYVRARLSAAREGVDETSGAAADPTTRAGIAGSGADLGAQVVADDDTEGLTAIGEAGGAAAPVGAARR
jgi:hypothetical protein